MQVRAAIEQMERSGIRQVMDLAWATPGVIHLEVGEPDFPTPGHISEAAIVAIRQGETRYTPNAGIGPLREALSEKVARRNDIAASADNIIVAAGAVEAIYASMLCMLNPGDEILLPDPGWPNFRMMATLLSATPRYYRLSADNDFLPDPDQIASLITPRTKALLLNSPSNPLGNVIHSELAREIYDVAARHDLWIISDECYDEIVYEGERYSIGSEDPDGRVVSTYSVSKTYAMTGWRVGYAVAPSSIVGEMAKVQEPIISCVSSPAQFAALAAVSGPQDCVVTMRNAYRERRDAAVAEAQRRGLTFLQPEGAFYLWVSCESAGISSLDFSLDAITSHHTAMAPGSAFGANGEGWIRISLANSVNHVLAGVTAIADQLDRRAEGA